MFKILNRNREVVGLITSPINPIIEDNLTGMNELKFSVPATQEGLELEGYIRIENEHEYVIKEISTHGHNREVIAIMNVEELIGKVWTTFRSVDTYPTACIREIVAGTGWTVVDNCPPNKRRNLYGTQMSSWDLIFLACDVWGIEVKFDTHNKVITTQEKGGTDRGTYFMSDLNLKQLMHDSHTHKLITRVIPIGKDGLTIEKVNGGKNYISNHSYSNKVITGIWQSDRYTKAQDLMDDAREYLAEMCVPYESYECKVSDLYRLEKNPNFEFNVGDVIYLIDNITKKKIQQRIIKHTKNLTAPDKDTINLANKSMSFTDYYKRLQLISNMTEQAIGSDGLISSGSIESVEADKITGEITASNVKTNTIVSEHIKADQILAGHIKADQIYGEHIVSDEIDTRHLKADSIRAEHISAGEIDADHISAESIQSGHISTGAIHAGHVQAGSINSNHIQTNTISSGHLQTGSVDAGHIKAGVIDSSHISTQSITSDHIQTNSIKAEHIQSGSIQTGHIQTGAITAGSGIIANGAIGSAQIASLDANKINAGEIDTSKVKIKGENGFLFIENNTLYVVDNNKKIRCELGVIEDNSNYGFVVRGADGQTIMLDHRGVHNAGITDGAIDNRKVSENANISGKKLDIDSVVRSINEDGSVTLQGTKVQIGNTTLDVKLSEQNNLITEQGQRLATQQSEITANTNAIKLKVDNQTYTADKNEINTKLNKATSDISVMKGQIALKVEQTDIENAVDELEGIVDQKIKDAKAEIKVTTDSISQRVSSNESTTSTLSTKVTTIEGTANTANSNATNALNKANTATTTANSAKDTASSASTKADGAVSTANTAKSTADKAQTTANSANTLANTANNTANTNKNNITTLQTTVTTTNNKVAELTTNLDGITQRVASTESTLTTTTNKINNLQVGGRNLILNTSATKEYTGSKGTTSYIDVFAVQSSCNLIDTEYTVSFDAKADSPISVNCYFYSPNTTTYAESSTGQTSTGADGSCGVSITTGWKRYWVKWKQTSTDSKKHIIVGRNATDTNLYIRAVKLEVGNKATDWTPAPEDVDASIASVDSKVQTTNNKVAEITTNLDGITQRVSSTESTVSSHTTQLGTVDSRINTAKDSAISTASSDATTKANNALASAKADATTKANNALADAKTYTNGQITTVNTTINNKVAEIKATTDAITQRVSSTESTTSTLTTKVNTAQSTADSATTKANNAQATANTANSTANTANAQATANKNNISTLTTTVSNTNNKVSSLETNLSAITSRVSATETNLTTTTNKLNDLKVGGTNLLRDTRTLANWSYGGYSLQTGHYDGTMNAVYINYKSSSGVNYYDFTRNNAVWVEPNTEYTLSFWAKGTGKFFSYLYGASGGTVASGYNSSGDTTTGSDGAIITTLKSAGQWQRYWVTWKTNSSVKQKVHIIPCRVAQGLGDCEVLVCGVKLERGNKSTEWSPSPEDIETTVSNLTTRVSNAESKLTKDSLTTTIGSHYTTSSDVNGIVTSKGYATTSQVQQTKSELTATFTEAGGYNLIKNSTGYGKTSCWIPSAGSVRYNTQGSLTRTGNSHFLYLSNTSLTTGEIYAFSSRFPLKGGKKYTLSGWFYMNPNVNSYDVFVLTSNSLDAGSTSTGYDYVHHSGAKTNTGWEFLSFTFTTHSDVKSGEIRIDNNGYNGNGNTVNCNVHWSSLMLNEGSVALPWSPHPSEVYEGITTIDKDGIQVSQSNISTTTKMNASGFYIQKTDGTNVFKVDSGGLKMTGDIQGSTFSSANDIFQVLSDGTVETDDINVSGTVSTDTLTVNKISNPRYPEVLDKAMTVYIKSGASSPDDFYHGAVYGSFKDMLAVAPRNLQGYTLDIVMQSNITENVSLTWFTSGQVDISFQGFTLYGYLYCYGASMVYRLYGGNSDATKIGKIMPSCGRSMGSYYYALAFQYCQFAVNNIGLYPDTTNTTNSGGICANRGARGNIFDATAYGSMRYLVRSEYGSHVYVGKTSGTCNNATFCASTGSIISINNDNPQAGRSTSGNPYWVGSGGMIVNNQLLGMSNITFGTTANSGSNTNTSTGSSQTVTETITASLADTYRSTVYNNWKKDGTVRQGEWGYGNCTGLWFFDNKLSSALSKGTTKSVSIKITRQSGGNSGAVTHTLKVHNHATRPSGAPTMGSTLTTFSLATGASTTLTFKKGTHDSIISALKSAKGIGLQSSYSNSTYSVCSGTITVKVTYTT